MRIRGYETLTFQTSISFSARQENRTIQSSVVPGLGILARKSNNSSAMPSTERSRAAVERAREIFRNPAVHAAKAKAHKVNVNVVREIVIGLSLRLAGGMAWKMYHTNLRWQTEELYAGEAKGLDAYTCLFLEASGIAPYS